MILGLDERKGWMVSETRFSWQIFGSILHSFLPCSVVSLTELCYGLKDLFTLHMLADKESCPWLLKLMTSQAVQLWVVQGQVG